jgi:hypothetical protein
MAIDNKYDATDKQYPEDEGGVVSAITRGIDSVKALGIPIPDPFSAFFSVLDSMSREAREQRGIAFIRLLVEDMQKMQDDVAKMRTDIREVQAAMRLSIQFDVDEFNDAKRLRYISAITKAISSGTKVIDLPTFIQDIEKLGERDIVGLKVLNTTMNQEGDWKENIGSIPAYSPTRLHPNTFTHRAEELSKEMARELRGSKAYIEGNTYSREEGLQICYRLQGFGLAEVIEVSPREVPISNYCARPTARGLMLLMLLGEKIANWKFYFDASQIR